MRGAVQINRHGRLAPGALKRCYLRRFEHFDAASPEYDDYYYYLWDYDELCWCPACQRRQKRLIKGWLPDTEPHERDLALHPLWKERLRALRSAPRLADRLLQGGAVLPSAMAPTPDAVAPLPVTASGQPLEGALFDYLQRITADPRGLEASTVAALLDAIDRRNGGVDGIEAALEALADRPGIAVMALQFAPFWIRPIRAWRVPEGASPASAAASLVEHLFVHYPVPPALLAELTTPDGLALKWLVWLVLLGQGGSLRRAARRFGWEIPTRFEHLLAQAPAGLRAAEACMWAEVHRLGGSEVEYHRIRREPALVLDPTEGSSRAVYAEWNDDLDPDHDRSDPRHAMEAVRSWRRVVRWLVANAADLDDARCEVTLPWIIHRETELGRARAAGREAPWYEIGARRAFELAVAYRDSRDSGFADLRWAPRGWDWPDASTYEPGWSIRELTSGSALIDEGRAMHHCVAGYAPQCASGISAIFSVMRDGQRCLTVELDAASGRAVQVRGAWNRAPQGEERAVVDRWLQSLTARGVIRPQS